MYTIIQERYNAQSGTFEKILTESISPETAKEIDNYFTLNKIQPEKNYRYTIPGTLTETQKQCGTLSFQTVSRVYHTCCADLPGFIEAIRKPSIQLKTTNPVNGTDN